MAGLAFRLSQLVTVRDAASLGWVRTCHDGAAVHVIPDPAFFVEPPVDMTPGDGVGIVARVPTPAEAHRSPDVLKMLAAVAVDLMERGSRVELVSLHQAEDREFIAALEAEIREVSEGVHAARIAWLPPSPEEAIAHLATFEHLVSVRLHGVILGAIAGVPAVAVAYDAKVREAAVRLGLGDLALDLPDATFGAVRDSLHELVAHPERRARLNATVSEIREQRSAVTDLIVGALG